MESQRLILKISGLVQVLMMSVLLFLGFVRLSHAGNSADIDRPPPPAEYPVKVMTKSTSGQVLLFESKDAARVIVGHVLLLKNGVNESISAFRVIKKFPERSAFAANEIKKIDPKVVLKSGQKYTAVEQGTELLPTPERKLASVQGPQRFWLAFYPMYLMSSTTSTDLTRGGNFTLVSKIYTGLEMNFIQRWSESFRTYTGMKVTYIEYSPLVKSTKTLNQQSNVLTSFELGAMAQFFTRLHLGFSAAMQNDIFLLGASSSSVTQSGILIPTFGASLGWDLVRMRGFGVNVSGFYAYKMGATGDSFTVNTGSAYGGKIAFRQFVEGDDRLEISLGALQRSQGTSTADQTETLFALAVRILVPLF